MLMNLYVAQDLVAKESSPIFEAKNDGVAFRNFKAMILSQKCDPKDFTLYHIGTMDHELNVLSVLPVRQVIIDLAGQEGI